MDAALMDRCLSLETRLMASGEEIEVAKQAATEWKKKADEALTQKRQAEAGKSKVDAQLAVRRAGGWAGGRRWDHAASILMRWATRVDVPDFIPVRACNCAPAERF